MFLFLSSHAKEYAAKLKKNEKLPFKKITYCNIGAPLSTVFFSYTQGNPQAVGQPPVTFPNQVLALMNYPAVLEHEGVEKLFPDDVITRAKEMLAEIGPTGLLFTSYDFCYLRAGAYSHSAGHLYFRTKIAQFINKRDGRPENDFTYASPDKIFMSDGGAQVYFEF